MPSLGSHLDIRAWFRSHSCISAHCDTLYSTFTTTLVPSTVPYATSIASSFPPQYPNVLNIVHMVRDWCSATTGPAVMEGVCAVCARLFFMRELQLLPDSAFDLGLLIRPEVTRMECHDEHDPVVGIQTPLLHPAGVLERESGHHLYMCSPCLNVLCKRRLPQHALANGLWLGEVLECLAILNPIEKMLIARYRHNYFVVKVDKGQHKLCANAVVFPQPVARL
ncbi:hypothetical protein OBBRIDRAFT_741932, partial [Obba rivulosa]